MLFVAVYEGATISTARIVGATADARAVRAALKALGVRKRAAHRVHSPLEESIDEFEEVEEGEAD